MNLANEMNEIGHLGDIGQPVGVTVVFGGQAGSEGKGAIAGWLSRKYKYAITVSTFMPNAGHTWIGENGENIVVTQLPIGLVGNSKFLGLGASSVINLELLEKELADYDADYNVADRLVIHPRAQVMHPEYIEWEKENLKYIASTGKGCGAAIAAKARREESVTLAKDHPTLKRWVRPNFDAWINDTINGGGGVLAEQSQGFDLDINHGHSYPYCTSRQCTPSQICADLALEARLITNSIAVVRTHPIRVGNVEGGTSGDYGSEELSWGEISGNIGRKVEEITTVTKRVRRVFKFDFERINRMSNVCRPTVIALTFADYIDPGVKNITQEDYESEYAFSLFRLSKKTFDFVYQVEAHVRRSTLSPKVRLIKTGPQNHHILDLGITPY